jgi:hypothetical protein
MLAGSALVLALTMSAANAAPTSGGLKALAPEAAERTAAEQVALRCYRHRGHLHCYRVFHRPLFFRFGHFRHQRHFRHHRSFRRW